LLTQLEEVIQSFLPIQGLIVWGLSRVLPAGEYYDGIFEACTRATENWGVYPLPIVLLDRKLGGELIADGAMQQYGCSRARLGTGSLTGQISNLRRVLEHPLHSWASPSFVMDPNRGYIPA